MPRRIQLGTQRDFTGGLNLRADAFNLAQNESPDLLNVDVDPRGGFSLRRGVATYANDAAAEVHSLMGLQTTAGVAQIIGGTGTSIKYTTGAGWTTLTATRSAPLRSAVFKDRIYIISGASGSATTAVRWSGSAEQVISEPAPANWNNNLAAPTTSGDGRFPQAKTVAVHMGSVFVGNTRENSVNFQNRIRWSHPNWPEDWADYHFIDVDTGTDGDEITAMVPYRDMLVVFKRNSMHVVFGEPPDRLQIQTFDREVGTPSQESCVQTENGIYFWAPNKGIYQFDGRSLEPRFEALRPAVDEGMITTDQQNLIQVGYGNRRLWVAVPWDGSSTRSRAFILDPSLGKKGSWVAYDLAVGPFLEWQPTTGAPLFLAAHVGGSRVLKVDQFDVAADNFGSGAVNIDSYYTTRWFDLQSPSMEKRWRHPDVVTREGDGAIITVQAFKDYDYGTVSREWEIETDLDENVAVWGVTDWDEAVFANEGATRLKVHRGVMLGSARAMALKFIGPTDQKPWTVDSVAMKFLPKRLK